MDRFVLSPVPAHLDPATNEHKLEVPDCLLQRRGVALEMREDSLARLREAVPDLAASGRRCTLARAPSDEDIARLREVAEWYGFPFEATVRSDEDFSKQRRLRAARRNGRWNR